MAETEIDRVGRLQDTVRRRAEELRNDEEARVRARMVQTMELDGFDCALLEAAAREILGEEWEYEVIRIWGSPPEIAIRGRV
jgi:hypothetical protein